MTALDIKKALYGRNFFRFTGPPENWLTAIKYMTWGMEEKYMKPWKRIKQGDVFLMHSTVKSNFYKLPISSIVGIGVVGGQFKMKKDFLWVEELRSKINKWPLLVPLSEIYLFSELPPSSAWDAPGIAKNEDVTQLISILLKHAIPTRAFREKFPVMGSWSSIRQTQVEDLFSKDAPILHDEFYQKDDSEKDEEFLKIKEVEDSIRNIPSLKFLDGNKVRVRKPTSERSIFDRDNSLLERAEESHAEILGAAIKFFERNGFDTWYNNHVDLLAESKDRAFLVEVKSTVNATFRKQARRAVGQLFEYEHFDVRRYFEKKSKTTDVNKILMVTNDPKDNDYTSYLNSLKVHVAWPTGARFSVRGQAGPLENLIQN